jgi:hypothetical protein
MKNTQFFFRECVIKNEVWIILEKISGIIGITIKPHQSGAIPDIICAAKSPARWIHSRFSINFEVCSSNSDGYMTTSETGLALIGILRDRNHRAGESSRLLMMPNANKLYLYCGDIWGRPCKAIYFFPRPRRRVNRHLQTVSFSSAA